MCIDWFCRLSRDQFKKKYSIFYQQKVSSCTKFGILTKSKITCLDWRKHNCVMIHIKLFGHMCNKGPCFEHLAFTNSSTRRGRLYSAGGICTDDAPEPQFFWYWWCVSPHMPWKLLFFKPGQSPCTVRNQTWKFWLLLPLTWNGEQTWTFSLS